MVPAHVDAHTRRGRHLRIRAVPLGAMEPVVLDDKPDRFSIRDGWIDGSLRLRVRSQVEQGDGAAPPLPVLADLFVRDGGRDVTEQEPRLSGAELKVAPLTVGVDRG